LYANSRPMYYINNNSMLQGVAIRDIAGSIKMKYMYSNMIEVFHARR